MSKRTLSEKELIFLGKIMIEELDFKRGVSYFTKAIKINPNNPELYIMRGDENSIEQLQGLCKRAIKDYTRAIELAPDNPDPDAYFKRAIVRIYTGDYKKALRDIQTAQKILGNNVMTKELAYCPFLDYLGNHRDAGKIMDKTIEIYSNNSLVYEQRALIHNRLENNWYAVFEDCRSALAISSYYSPYRPECDFDYGVFNLLGEVEYKRGNYELASMYFKRVLNANYIYYKELHTKAHGGISRIAIKRNNYEKAILYFKKAMKIVGENAFMRSPFNDIAEDLARIKCLRGEYQEAFDCINEIIKYGEPRLYYSYRHCIMRAYINMMLGRTIKARHDIANAHSKALGVENKTDFKKEFIKIASTWTPDYKSRKEKIEKLIEDVLEQ